MSTAEVYNEDMRRKALKASGDDLIRRRDVINAIFDAPIADLFDVTAKKTDLVSAVIQIQPERKKGKWIGTDTKFGIRIYHCSECKADLMQWSVTRHCPNCGALMWEEDDE